MASLGILIHVDFQACSYFCWRRQYGDSAVWESYGVVTVNVPRNMLTCSMFDQFDSSGCSRCFATSFIKQDGREDLTVYERYWGSLHSRSCWCRDCRRAWIFLQWRMLRKIPLSLCFCWVFYPGEWLKFTLKSKIRLGNFLFSCFLALQIKQKHNIFVSWSSLFIDHTLSGCSLARRPFIMEPRHLFFGLLSGWSSHRFGRYTLLETT